MRQHGRLAGRQWRFAGRQWWVVLLLPVLVGCETERNGVRVNLTQAAQFLREHQNRRPTRGEARQLMAQLPPAQLNDLGVMYEREGRLEEATWAYEHAIAASPLSPASSLIYVNLGNVLRRQGRTEEARRRYRQALNTDPSNFVAANNLGDLCASERVEVEDAIQRLTPLVTRESPYRAYGLDTLGALYHARGDDAKAREVLEAARTAGQGDAGLLMAVHGHLAEVYRARGQEAEAKQHEAEAARLRADAKQETK